MSVRRGVCVFLACCAGFAQTPQSEAEKFAALSSAAAALQATKPDQAVDVYKQALVLRPKWADGWFGLAGLHFRQKRYSDARSAFEKVIELMPGNGAAWAYLGLCESHLGQQDKAIADIRKGEQIGLGAQTTEVQIREQVAWILIYSSIFDQAINQIQPLSKYQLNAPELIELAGQCALTDSRVPSEIPASRRPAITLAGKAIWDAMIHAPAKQIHEEFQQLLALYPKEPGVHYAYGLYLQNTTDQAAALAEFQKELAAHPDHWPSLLGSAFLLTRQDKPEEAIAATERGCKAAPLSYKWMCDAEIGRARLSMDQPEKAVPALEESVKLHPSNSQTHFYLAQAYRRVGRKDEAEKERQEFLRIKAQADPNSVPGVDPGAKPPSKP